jgi:hypothetical protein
MLAVLYLAEN